jgi:hypothetical protein
MLLCNIVILTTPVSLCYTNVVDYAFPENHLCLHTTVFMVCKCCFVTVDHVFVLEISGYNKESRNSLLFPGVC